MKLRFIFISHLRVVLPAHIVAVLSSPDGDSSLLLSSASWEVAQDPCPWRHPLSPRGGARWSGGGELRQGLRTREPPKAVAALVFLAIDNFLCSRKC